MFVIYSFLLMRIIERATKKILVLLLFQVTLQTCMISNNLNLLGVADIEIYRVSDGKKCKAILISSDSSDV